MAPFLKYIIKVMSNFIAQAYFKAIIIVPLNFNNIHLELSF